MHLSGVIEPRPLGVMLLSHVTDMLHQSVFGIPITLPSFVFIQVLRSLFRQLIKYPETNGGFCPCAMQDCRSLFTTKLQRLVQSCRVNFSVNQNLEQNYRYVFSRTQRLCTCVFSNMIIYSAVIRQRARLGFSIVAFSSGFSKVKRKGIISNVPTYL